MSVDIPHPNDSESDETQFHYFALRLFPIRALERSPSFFGRAQAHASRALLLYYRTMEYSPFFGAMISHLWSLFRPYTQFIALR